MIGILIGLKEKSNFLGSFGPQKSAQIAIFVLGGSCRVNNIFFYANKLQQNIFFINQLLSSVKKYYDIFQDNGVIVPKSAKEKFQVTRHKTLT